MKNRRTIDSISISYLFPSISSYFSISSTVPRILWYRSNITLASLAPLLSSLITTLRSIEHSLGQGQHWWLLPTRAADCTTSHLKSSQRTHIHMNMAWKTSLGRTSIYPFISCFSPSLSLSLSPSRHSLYCTVSSSCTHTWHQSNSTPKRSRAIRRLVLGLCWHRDAWDPWNRFAMKDGMIAYKKHARSGDWPWRQHTADKGKASRMWKCERYCLACKTMRATAISWMRAKTIHPTLWRLAGFQIHLSKLPA